LSLIDFDWLVPQLTQMNCL